MSAAVIITCVALRPHRSAATAVPCRDGDDATTPAFQRFNPILHGGALEEATREGGGAVTTSGRGHRGGAAGAGAVDADMTDDRDVAGEWSAWRLMVHGSLMLFPPLTLPPHALQRALALGLRC